MRPNPYWMGWHGVKVSGIVRYMLGCTKGGIIGGLKHCICILYVPILPLWSACVALVSIFDNRIIFSCLSCSFEEKSTSTTSFNFFVARSVKSPIRMAMP